MNRRAFALGFVGLPLSLSRPCRADLPALHRACANGEVDEVRRLLDADPAGAKRYDDEGNLPLHHAAWNGRPAVALLLLERGAEIDALRRDAHPTTALEMASYFGYTDVVRVLLEHGADPKRKVFEGYTALHKAAQNGHNEVVRLLVRRGALLEAEKADGQTALHLAAANGRTETVQCLLTIGADPAHRDSKGVTPAALASGAGRTALLAHLGALAETGALKAGRDAAAPPSARPAGETIVYRNAFAAAAPGREWSTTPLGDAWSELQVSTAPGGGVRFLGPFASQEVRLALGKLPPHGALLVTLDLLVIGTWDGNGWPNDGPDRFDVSVLDGPNLLHTTFLNAGTGRETEPIQAFPGDWPAAHHPGFTGAEAKNRLGIYTSPEFPAGFDATYRLAFSFAHRADTLVLRLAGRGLQNLEDESWGVAAITVRALRYAAPGPARR